MVRSSWFVRGLLVGIIGLMSNVSFAADNIRRHVVPPSSITVEQSDAYSLSKCLDDAEYTSSLTPGNNNSGNYVLTASCSKRTNPSYNPSSTSGSSKYKFYYACGYSRQTRATSSSPWYVSYGACAISPSGAPSSACTTSSTVSCPDTYVAAYYFSSEVNVCLSKKDTYIESYTRRAPTPNGSGIVCDSGCRATVDIGYEGTYPSGKVIYGFYYDGTECSSSETPEPVDDPIINDADGDGISDKDDKCPNDSTNRCHIPDDTRDTDNDGTPDYKDPNPTDPTNGGGDADGDPTNGTNTSVSGGADCVTPPTCKGDAIQCNILYQAWSTRCGNNGQGQGTSTGGGQSTDVSGIENRLDGTNSKLDGVNSKLSDVFGDDGTGQPGSDGNMDGVKGGLSFGTSDLDSSGFGFSRTCNFFQDVTINMGVTSFVIPMASSTGLCDIFTWSGLLLVAIATYYAVLILIRD